MDEDIRIKKVSEKKISETKKTISWILGVIGILIILSQAIPLLVSYVQGQIQLSKQNSMKDPLPQSYKQYIQDEFAYYDPGKATLRIYLKQQKDFSIRDFSHMTQQQKQQKKLS